MAAWSTRSGGGTRDGLTVYQLQQLISTGQVAATDEVCEAGGTWARVADVPSLARHLPEAAAEAAPKPGSTVIVAGVALEVGPDGRPLPPPPEVIARMLATQSDAPVRARFQWFGRAILVVTFVCLSILIVMLVRMLMAGPSAE